MPDVLLYTDIYPESAAAFVQRIDDLDQNGEDVTVRINTIGGSPELGFGMITRFHEVKGVKKVKIDGQAYSMGLFYAVYCDDVECVDVAEFLLHRASYNAWYERSEYFTPEIRANLERINKSLDKALRNRIGVSGVQKLEEIISKREGLEDKSLKDIFSMDQRVDLFLSAKEAKQIGLVSKIITITPSKKQEISAMMHKAAHHMPQNTNAPVAALPNAPKEVEKPKNSVMTLEEFRTQNPEAYNSIVKVAVDQERDRVGAWMQFNEVDPSAVKDGIEKGGNISQTVMAEFMIKMNSPERLAAIKKASTGPVADKPEEVIEPTEVDKVKSALFGELKIDVKNK